MKMQLAAPVLIAELALTIGNSIAADGHLPVQPLPDRQRTGQVEQGGQDPELGEPPGQVADRCRPTMAFLRMVGWNEIHLFHQLGKLQVRIALLDTGIVNGEEGESVFSVKPG